MITSQPAKKEFETSSPPILQVRGLTVRFAGVTALDQVDFELRASEIHCLMGENGAGKSTLSKVLSGVQLHYEGELLLRGEVVRFKSVRDSQDQQIGMIHQELNLVPELSIFENIFLGRELRYIFGVQRERAMVAETERLLQELGSDLNPQRKVRELRVSERQLVEIAKALSLRATILIMDEPTSALSVGEVERLFTVIRQLRARGVAIIYISHRLEEVFAISDRITVLRDGKHVLTAPTESLSRHELIRQMVGRSVEAAEVGTHAHPREQLLEARQLTLRRPGVVPLKGVSLILSKGEVVGVAGLMGSGQTELLESLFGVYSGRYLSGEILLDGQRLRLRSPQDAIAHGLGYVSEDRKGKSLVLGSSVRSNTTLAALGSFAGPLGVVRERRERQAVSAQIEALGIRTPSLETPVMTLSGGNQQKVVLAKFLLTRPRVLLLNEPTRGIDVGAKAQVYELIRELAAQGTACLLASSELLELLALCDRILVLCEGRLTAEFSRAEATQAAILEAAMQFEEAA